MELETVVNDSGPATQEPCPICGSNDYFQEGGFYYCSLCNTQSQVSQLYVDEDFHQEYQQVRTAVGVLRGEKRKKGAKIQESRKQLSTWEIWNVVLKNMADRLIEIGFPEAIRAKVFHIFVTFMKKRKVIFVSTSDPNGKSTVTLGEPKTNLYGLCGIQKPVRNKATHKRKQLVKKKKSKFHEDVHKMPSHEDEVSFSTKTAKAMSKRKAIEKEYLSKEKGTPEIDEHEFENIISEESRSRNQLTPSSGAGVAVATSENVRPRYTTSVNKLFRTKKWKSHNMRQLLHQNEKRFGKRGSSFVTRKFMQDTKIERFTLSSCLIVVFVALRELGFPVVMTDIIRLNLVGILHFGDVGKLIKEEQQYQDVEQLHSTFLSSQLITIHSFCEEIKSFVEYIGIAKFCCPQINEIIPKYIDEFVLPREFECLVNLVSDMFTFNDYVDDLPTLHLEKYITLPEVFVVVQFVVLLKMLFGLDDKTEKYQSEFAKLVNEILREQVEKRGWSMEEWTELFVIEQWFGYLQRRRELVRRELCCTSMYSPNRPPTVTKLDDIMRTCSLEGESGSTPQEKAAKSCKDLFEDIFKDRFSKLGENPEIPRLQPYVPLPLPTESIVRQYVDRYPQVGDKTVKPELLNVDFVQKRLDFIWNPKKYKKILKLKGYKLRIVHGDAINNFPNDFNDESVKSNVVLVFQPYKSFDEFVGRIRNDCSHSMKLILGLCEDIIPGISPEKPELKYCEPFLQKLVNAVGDMYIKRVLTELVPIMTRWAEADFNPE